MTTTMAIIVFLQLRNEFSVCRVYTSNGTLRTSFDRRPLNPPAAGLGDQAAAHRYQQQEALPPPAAAGSQMAAVDMVVAAANGQSSDEHSHGSSSSGSLGFVVDGAGDAAAAIDWDSLIPPVDYLRFSDVDDLSHVVWPPN